VRAAPLHDEVWEGELLCEQDHRFPIVRGVPRFLQPTQLSPIEHRSQAMFGYEWSWAADYNVENFRSVVWPETEALMGKLGLDVGCGAGRHLLAAVEAGAEMIGVDQSAAVDVVQQKIAAVPRAHVVQADLQALPFPRHTFDFLYSWGVLHHLREPEAAFHHVLPVLKPGGVVVVGLYQATWRKRLLEIPRTLTRRLPLRVARGVAWFCAFLNYYGLIVPYRFLTHILGPQRMPHIHPHIREYAKYSFHISHTDWFDRLTAPITHWYTREEIEGWFRRAPHLQEISVRPIGDFWWRGQARMPC